MALRLYQQSFNGGVMSPEMYGRAADVKYQSGLAKCTNFLIDPRGPAVARPGFSRVNSTKYDDKKARLIPFTFSTTQSLVLEFGEKYIRFHTDGQTVLKSDGTPYEISTPYSASEVFDIHYVQQADVVTLVHTNHAPMELKRYGATDWRLETISFTSPLTSPSAPTVTQSINKDVSNPTDYTRKYAVTALLADGTGESAIGASTTINCNPYGTGAYNTISWSAVSGASLYRVYRDQGGLWAYIGQTKELSIVDENISPDLSITPPNYDDPFAGDYPGAVSYFEQRRWFGGTNSRPNNIWATRSGTEADMSYSLPTQDTDRIAVRVAAREANRILHFIPLSHLILLTGAAEWRVSPLNNDAITPSSMSVRPQSYVGANNVQPVVVNNSALYAANRGGHLRECGYSYEAGGFVTNDVCVRANHLFDNLEIYDLAYAKAPFPIVWAVSSAGNLIAFTYIPEQQVGGFSSIETQGVFESCTVVSESEEDALYVVVRRTINGETKRFVEKMHQIKFTSISETMRLDCAGTYRGTAKKEITGLSWLEGETVSILADGGVEPQQKVVDGKITLEKEASLVHVGLSFNSDMQSLPLTVSGLPDGSYASGHKKNVKSVELRVVNSSGFSAGPSFEKLSDYPARSTEFAGSPPDPSTGSIGVEVRPQWSRDGQVCIRQSNPLPLKVISLTSVVEIV